MSTLILKKNEYYSLRALSEPLCASVVHTENPSVLYKVVEAFLLLLILISDVSRRVCVLVMGRLQVM